MPTVIFESHSGQTQSVSVPEGGALYETCDAIESPVPFHCRRGNCGTCRIAVLEGHDELLPPSSHESRTLRLLGLSEQNHRLACRAMMLPGAGILRVRPLGKRRFRPPLLRIPVVFDTASRRMLGRRRDASTADITISASELKSGEVVTLAYQLPLQAQPCEVIGRIVRCEPDGGPEGEPHHYVAVIELLEQDDRLVSLVTS